jgi:hypothetical protein
VVFEVEKEPASPIHNAENKKAKKKELQKRVAVSFVNVTAQRYHLMGGQTVKGKFKTTY